MIEDPRTIQEKAKASHEFLCGVVDLAKTHQIPLNGVVALFGLYAKTIADTRVEQGMSQDEAVMAVVGDFMMGLGGQVVRLDPDDVAPHGLH